MGVYHSLTYTLALSIGISLHCALLLVDSIEGVTVMALLTTSASDKDAVSEKHRTTVAAQMRESHFLKFLVEELKAKGMRVAVIVKDGDVHLNKVNRWANFLCPHP